MPSTGRELLLMRHAKSAWDTDAATDFERPLAKRGRRDAPRMGKWLRKQGLVPDRIVSSPAERARQTILAASEEIGFPADDIEFADSLYFGGVVGALHVLAKADAAASRVMLVGHNPTLEDLVLHLAAGRVRVPANGKLMPTAAIAHFRMPANWAALRKGDAELLGITRPKELKRGG